VPASPETRSRHCLSASEPGESRRLSRSARPGDAIQRPGEDGADPHPGKDDPERVEGSPHQRGSVLPFEPELAAGARAARTPQDYPAHAPAKSGAQSLATRREGAPLRSVKRVSRFALRLEAADSGSTRKCDRLGSNAHLLASSRFVPGRLGSSRGRVAHGSKRPGVRLAARPRALGWASTHAWWKAASLKKNNGSRSFATNDGKEVAASPSVMISPQIGHFVKPRTRTASSHPPKTSSGDLPKAATNSSGRTHRASRSRRTTGRLRPSHTDACAQ
jgi:hypothetical protein